MPVGERSEYTIRAEKLAEHMFSMYETILKAWEPGLGFERISRREFQRRWDAMSSEQRTAEIQRQGPDGVLALLEEAQ